MTQHETWTVPPGMAISDGAGGSRDPSAVPALIFPDFLGGILLDTDPHNFALVLANASVKVGAWTLNGSGDLVVPVAGVYECVFTTQLQRHATAPNEVTFAINSSTSDTELGPVLVVAAASASGTNVYADVRTFTTGVLAGQSFGTLQLTQTNAAAAAAGLAAFAQLSIRCLARA
jgi:hypothetical protein